MAQPKKRLSRRGFLRAGAATSIATATAYTVILPGVHGTDAADTATIPVAQVQLAQAPPMAMPDNILEGYTFFNPLMVDVVTAAAERIIPKDANGPGATDAGVVYFIDRQLSSEYGMVGKRYVAGPFIAGVPTQGDQLGSTMRDRYRMGVDGIQAYAQKQYQKNFKALTPEQQDQILRDMEAGTATGFTGITGQQFFQLLVGHVKAGFLADPVYGGNRDLAGWKMIGYPGAQIVYQDWIGRYGQKFTGPFMSLADHQEALHTGTNADCHHAATATTATATGNHCRSDRLRDRRCDDSERLFSDGRRPGHGRRHDGECDRKGLRLRLRQLHRATGDGDLRHHQSGAVAAQPRIHLDQQGERDDQRRADDEVHRRSSRRGRIRSSAISPDTSNSG